METTTALGYGVYGEKAGLAWSQEDPDHFSFTPCDAPQQKWSRGRDEFHRSAQQYSRIPAGHPEGLYESFANIYRSFIQALGKKLSGEALTAADYDFPTVEMGLRGVEFINKVCPEQ